MATKRLTKANTRNICILGHVDHAKSSYADSLSVSSARLRQMLEAHLLWSCQRSETFAKRTGRRRTVLYHSHQAGPTLFFRTVDEPKSGLWPAAGTEVLKSTCVAMDLPDLPRDVLRRVLSHKSMAQFDNYERLEAVGDAFLNAIVWDHLERQYPLRSLGLLKQLFDWVTGNDKLSDIAEDLGLKDRILMGHRMRGSRKILADVFEAYIAASARCNGFDGTRSWVVAVLDPYIRSWMAARDKEQEEEHQSVARARDGKADPSQASASSRKRRRDQDAVPPPAPEDADTPKFRLSVWAARKGHVLRYRALDLTLPSSDQGTRWFAVVLGLGRELGRGDGSSKRAAEQVAAAQALARLGLSPSATVDTAAVASALRTV